MIIIIFIQTNIQYFRCFSSIGNHCFANKSAPLRRDKPTGFETFFNKTI